jgi:hypothetical protein
LVDCYARSLAWFCGVENSNFWVVFYRIFCLNKQYDTAGSEVQERSGFVVLAHDFPVELQFPLSVDPLASFEYFPAHEGSGVTSLVGPAKILGFEDLGFGGFTCDHVLDYLDFVVEGFQSFIVCFGGLLSEKG